MLVGGKPLALEKKFLTDSLSEQIVKNNNEELLKLTVLLDSFDAEYQSILEKKVLKSANDTLP